MLVTDIWRFVAGEAHNCRRAEGHALFAKRRPSGDGGAVVNASESLRTLPWIIWPVSRPATFSITTSQPPCLHDPVGSIGARDGCVDLAQRLVSAPHVLGKQKARISADDQKESIIAINMFQALCVPAIMIYQRAEICRPGSRIRLVPFRI
jgi:hypothetical protein